jgi:SAM-dependent methyltransferase
MTTNPRDVSAAVPAACGPEDYRDSHVDRGPNYDSTLAASPFDTYMAKWEAHWLTEFVRQAYPQRIPRYLDFACGTGRITQTVAPLARESIGIDISSSMLEIARSKCPQARFVEADLTRERLSLGRFDVVTAFRFLGNAQDELRKDAVRAVAELLQPGGHFIVNNHRNPASVASLLHRATGGSHGMDLTYFRLRRLLLDHGFTLLRVRAIGMWLFRSSLQSRAQSTRWGNASESLLNARLFAPLAPDMVLIARKR